MAEKLIVFLCAIILSKGMDIDSLKLEQVLILSRHNVRTPLIGQLESYAAKPWPKWNDSAGMLTKKGNQLERHMGDYIAEWLDSEDFMEGCPKKEEVLIYANTKTRTLQTAEAFAESAFRTCNVTVQHYKNLDLYDPLFFPIFHNTSDAFKQQYKEEMQNKIDELNLTQSYLELSRILKIESADICKKLYLCDLNAAQNIAVTEDGDEPDVSGPIYIGNAVVDSFIMSFYEGNPISEVAWGEIITDDQWDLLLKISKAYQHVRFNSTKGSKDIARPLLKFMFDIFKSGTPKFTMLVGHDSNLNLVISALDFKPFDLSLQFEPFPIGGKIIFQKWSDVSGYSGDYLKIEYVYPSVIQLRHGERYTLLKPPQKVTLELNGCKISHSGFCPWSQFMELNVYS